LDGVWVSPVGLAGSGAISAGAEDGASVLFVEPAEKFLESGVLQDLFDSVEVVAELVMRPGFVDEIFAGMAGRGDVFATFAAWDDVMAPGGNIAFTEDATNGHAIEHRSRRCKTHPANGARHVTKLQTPTSKLQRTSNVHYPILIEGIGNVQ